MKLDNYKCEGQLSIFDYLKAADPEPKEEPTNEIEIGKWVDEHGPRVKFDDIKVGNYYIVDYSTQSHKSYKVVFVKHIKEDAVHYVDAPKGIKGQWSWGNTYSAMSRKMYIDGDEGDSKIMGLASTNGWWYELPSEEPEAAAPRELKVEPTEGKVCNYSGHTCNKANLWEVADTLDGIKCPHSCCRICAVNNCGARCNGSEEPPRQQDEYIKENPTCFYVFGHYLDKADGWHKVPEELPMFTPWQPVDVVLFGKKTGTAWIEHGKWEAKDWTFRSLDENRRTESTEILAWKLSNK